MTQIFHATDSIERSKSVDEYLGLNTPYTIIVQIKSDLSGIGLEKGSYVVVDKSINKPHEGQYIFCSTPGCIFPLVRQYFNEGGKLILDDGIHRNKPNECTIYGIVVGTFTRFNDL